MQVCFEGMTTSQFKGVKRSHYLSDLNRMAADRSALYFRSVRGERSWYNMCVLSGSAQLSGGTFDHRSRDSLNIFNVLTNYIKSMLLS